MPVTLKTYLEANAASIRTGKFVFAINRQIQIRSERSETLPSSRFELVCPKTNY